MAACHGMLSLAFYQFHADFNNQTDRLELIGEIETFIKVGRHPNIVSLVGACTFEGMASKMFRVIAGYVPERGN